MNSLHSGLLCSNQSFKAPPTKPHPIMPTLIIVVCILNNYSVSICKCVWFKQVCERLAGQCLSEGNFRLFRACPRCAWNGVSSIGAQRRTKGTPPGIATLSALYLNAIRTLLVSRLTFGLPPSRSGKLKQAWLSPRLCVGSSSRFQVQDSIKSLMHSTI